MTISVHSPTLTNGPGAGCGSALESDDEPNGKTLEWFKGVDRSWHSARRSKDTPAAMLTRVIEQEIIPRLFVAHDRRRWDGNQHYDDVRYWDISDTDAFAELVLLKEPAEILLQVQALLDQGISRQSIYIDLLTPVARRLGEYWEEDRCTFLDVSLALSRLQRVLRELCRSNGERVRRAPPKRRVYLVPAPGEQHTFGLSMVEEFFLEAGWESASDYSASAATILTTVAQHEFDVVGFSLSSETFLDPVSDLVKQLCKVSRNPDVAIIIGGHFLVAHPEFVSRIKGAVFACDELGAVDTAETLIGQTSRRAAASRQT